jgi:hypothetical protein
MLPLDAMHMRSDAALAAAKAQQQPQLDWSRMSPMTDAHSGQAVAESKDSGTSRAKYSRGRSASVLTMPRLTRSSSSSREWFLTPQRLLDAPTGVSTKRELKPAFHVVFARLMVSTKT